MQRLTFMLICIVIGLACVCGMAQPEGDATAPAGAPEAGEITSPEPEAEQTPPPTSSEVDGPYYDDYEDYSAPSLGERLAELFFGGCCSLVWLAFIFAILRAVGRRWYVMPWLWEIAIIASVANVAEMWWERLVSRRDMERELRARTHNPRDSRARYNLGVTYMRQRRWDLAAQELTSSIEINADRADAHYRLGLCHVEAAQVEQAILPLRECLVRREDHYDAQLLLARCLTEAHRIPDAREVAEAFLARHPLDVEGFYRMGMVEAEEGHADEAVARLTGCVERSRHSARPNQRRDRRLARMARAKLSELQRGRQP